MALQDVVESRRTAGLLLVAAAWCVQSAHLALLLVLPAPALWSNIMQLLTPLLTAGLCLWRAQDAADRFEQRRWLALTAAFAIWCAAQGLYLAMLCRPLLRVRLGHPDDALWLLFGLPLLFVIFAVEKQRKGTIRTLDALQALLFFAILYLAVFLPARHLGFAAAYNVQNAALFLCCLLRLADCSSDQERQFYGELSAFLGMYGLCTAMGDLLYGRGYASGSPVDLVWTMPITLFLTLVVSKQLSGAFRSSIRLEQTAGETLGLTVTTLATVSLLASALLARRHFLLGVLTGVGAFVLSAARNNTLERVWRRSRRSLQQAALSDPLTGLGNRLSLQSELAQRLKEQTPNLAPTLILLDISNFQSLNTSLGYRVGDQVLKQTAQRLQRLARGGALLFRPGCNTFAVLLSVADPGAAQQEGARLLEAFQSPFEVDGLDVCCTASTGVAFGAEITCINDLFSLGEKALGHAKARGRGHVHTWDAAALPEMRRRWMMAKDLRASVERGEIEVVYQPITRLQSLSIYGVEALARWSHPKYGDVPPTEFIPLAEEAGLIARIGEHVLRIASRNIHTWNQEHGLDLMLNVNLSPRQLTSPTLCSDVLVTLAASGLTPASLTLEVTESAALVGGRDATDALALLRSAGIRVSLDDFGTGYSSLSFLLDLPCDEVKIDRGFVARMAQEKSSDVLVCSLIALALSLDKEVVAEGVETVEDLRRLRETGCTYAQGWLLSRPLKAEQCSLALAASRTASLSYAAHMTAATAFVSEMPRTSDLRAC